MKKEWLNAGAMVLVFTVGFELIRKLINNVIMEGIFRNKLISNTAGGFITALEITLVCALALFCSNIVLIQDAKRFISILWKVIIFTVFIGFVVGYTYTAAIQSFYCGFIK